ncbi:MAG TPA: hypothetical protein VN976_22490 [Verrucomicrobiae bacterium]|nr:hypothetical protein [Verrucomicrobiae bacterium]
MRRLYLTWLTIIGILLGFSSVTNIWSAQQSPAETVPVSMVVSVEARHGKDIPVVNNKEDVRVFEGRDRLRVKDWIPLQGSQADLELLVLIDEAAGQTVASQFDDVRRFMSAQPPTTAIAVGYLEYGTVRMVQNFTKDHDAAGKALRIPMGAVAGGSSPYLSITDVVKRWPETKSRHTIFLISDGIDPLQPGITDSYLDQAIETAQRTGTQVYSIYASEAGHFGHTLWRINQGQNNLSELADKTGGESYFQGLSTPVSFGPFLDEFAERLNHQYLLTFLIKPEKKPSYRHVRLETEVPNAELVTADRVYVSAAK